MNTEQLASVLRIVLQFAAGYFVSKGIVDESTATTVSAALISLAVAGWGIYLRRNTGLVASAASVPDVKVIEASKRLADAIPSNKVQASVR